MIGGRDHPDDREPTSSPIDYDAAVREILRRRRWRRVLGILRKIPDPRPAAPGQVVLAGLAILLLGALVPAVHVGVLIGAIAIVLGFASGLIQPRGRRVVWRNKTREIPPDKRWTDRLYYLFYRHGEES